MPLKSSFAHVLKAIRNKRSITQRHFADTVSRTYLSKLESGKSSITLDKLDQVSRRLDLSPLTLLAFTLSQDSGQPVGELIQGLRNEMLSLQKEGGFPDLQIGLHDLPEPAQLPSPKAPQSHTRKPKRISPSMPLQAELALSD